MGDMIYYDFRFFCYQQLPNDQPNILFDICSAERDGWYDLINMISDPFVTNNFQMINQTFCLTSVHFIVQQRGF